MPRITKISLALVLALAASPVLATGKHWFWKPPMMKPPVVVVPPPVTPPPTTVPPPTSQPAAQAGTASGTGPWGWYAMGFVLVFYYLSICQLEEQRDPEMFKLLMCPPTPDPTVWKTCNPFSQAPCQ